MHSRCETVRGNIRPPATAGLAWLGYTESVDKLKEHAADVIKNKKWPPVPEGQLDPMIPESRCFLDRLLKSSPDHKC